MSNKTYFKGPEQVGIRLRDVRDSAIGKHKLVRAHRIDSQAVLVAQERVPYYSTHIRSPS